MKNKFRFHLCLICMFVFAVAGCKVKRPSDVISESKMENLLYDYHVAKSMGDNLPYSENYKKALYIDAVFKKYGTTQAAFDSSMVWYTRNTEILSKIYDKVKKRLKDEQELVGDLIAKRDKKPKMTKQGDSIDVWPWQRMVRLTGEMMDNQYVFTLPTDSNYKDRDTLVWEVRYRFLEPMLADSLRGVSLKKIATKENADSLHKVIDKNKDDIQRLTPEEMNRRRTGTHREKKPEQIQVEQHIQKERIEQRKERQMNQRRQQQQRRSNN